MSNRNCCVVNCAASKKKDPSLVFYSFPNKDYQLSQREKWIIAVKRHGGGVLWQPSKNTVVCSQHFVSGRKSNEINNVDYIPTVFPKIYGKRAVKQPQVEARLARVQRRQSDVGTSSAVVELTQEWEREPLLKEMSTQAGLDLENGSFQFFCERNGEEVVQTSIPIQCLKDSEPTEEL